VSEFLGNLAATLITGVALGIPVFLTASGLTLIYGVMRVLNFAHGAFFMFGAFLVAVALHGAQVTLPVYLAASVAGGLVVAALGILSERIVFRPTYQREHVIGLLAAYSLLLILQGLSRQLFGTSSYSVQLPSGVAGSFRLAGIPVATYHLVLIAVGILAAAGLIYLLQGTEFGRRVRAVAHDRTMASVLAISPAWTGVQVFAIGAFLAGLAGALEAPLVSVDSGLAVAFILDSFAVVIIGGMGSVPGSLVASLLLGVLQAALVSFAPSLSEFSLYIAVGVVLLLRPQGLFGRRATA
jgi:branched-subunit amino acid ABC-type transport system permease component